MKLLTCPINGPRPLQEFVFGGEVRPMPDAAACSDKEWADYVFNRAGEPGISKEWWYHVASGTWFIAERDNMKDIVLKTYLYTGRGGAHLGSRGSRAADGGEQMSGPDAGQGPATMT